MDAATRELVRQRANGKCEYCRFPDHASSLPFHIEHIVATVHRSDDAVTNLAWACARCNLRKGTNLSTIDPETGQRIELFNPRSMKWHEHFVINDAYVSGITACGRGTTRLLDMNNENRLIHRRQLISQGEYD